MSCKQIRIIVAVALGIVIGLGLLGLHSAKAGSAVQWPISNFLEHQVAFGQTIKVMSRNMYVGTDVDAVLTTSSPEEIPLLVAQAWATLQATNFDERAAAMADEIALHRPHLVGLQEVSLIRIQSPGDLIIGGTTPAEDVVHDFIETLQAELAARGQNYSVVAMIQDTDIELPMIKPDDSFDDVRLTDFDAILARDDVGIANVTEQHFLSHLPVPDIDVLRGWVAVDATVKRETYRFVNTHIEPYPDVNREQIGELISSLASETRPMIVVGDFNSDAEAVGVGYGMMLDAGYEDVWVRRRWLTNPGYTCCQTPDLANEKSLLSKRFDFVFTRNMDSYHSMTWRTGHLPWFKTESGLWPSDHAGVFAKIFRWCLSDSLIPSMRLAY
jgi:hypothetical protein